tara:strand:+ start:2587 stop:3438 length:852 start_codon:yes stop_codon:yes gene_type:complete
MVAVGWCGLAAVSAAQEKSFEQTVEFVAGSRLELQSDAGSVRLTAWDQERVEISARIVAPPDAASAQSAVDGTTVEVRGNRRSLRIRSNYSGVSRSERGWRAGVPHVHYEIRLPSQVDLELSLDRSDTTLSGLEGQLIFELDRSDLTVAELSGTTTIVLDRGGLEARDLSGVVALDVDRGDRLRVDGVDGSLDLELDRTDAVLTRVRLDGDSAVGIDRGDLLLELMADQPLSLEVQGTRRTRVQGGVRLHSGSGLGEYSGAIGGGGVRLHIDADRGVVRLDTN